MTPELSDEIRNKIQPALTALESIRDNKEVSKEFINRAIDDLEKIIKLAGE